MAAGKQATDQGWRWSYRTIGICTAVVFMMFLFFYEETKSDPIIRGLQTVQSYVEEPTKLVDEGQELDKSSGVKTRATASIRPASAENHVIDRTIQLNSWKKRLAFVTYSSEPIWPYFYRPFVVLFTFPTVLFTGLQYAAGVVWLSIMASVIGLVFPLPPYNFLPAQIGYMSTGPFIGNLIGALYGGFLADRSIIFHSKRNKGLFEPEMRLYLLHLPALCMTGGILMFGISISKVSCRAPPKEVIHDLTSTLKG